MLLCCNLAYIYNFYYTVLIVLIFNKHFSLYLNLVHNIFSYFNYINYYL